MPQSATIKNLPRAFRMMEAMQAQGVEWGEDYRGAHIKCPQMSASVLDRAIELKGRRGSAAVDKSARLAPRDP